jgi:uncharacterized protein YjbI with pentapeptide repeats
MPSVDDVQEPGDLDGLDKDGLIAFLKSDREDRIELWNAWREANDWQPVDLERAVLRDAHLDGVDLIKARLDGADLWGVHLEEAKLNEAHLDRVSLREAHLRGADLPLAHLRGAGLIETHLEGADLSGAHLEGAFLIGARLEGASLWGAHLEGADLLQACLEGVDLFKAHLEEANLLETHLEGANLWEAHLGGATLSQAHLEGATLSQAHLRGVALSPVASLRGVKLYQAHFWGVLSLRYEQLVEASYLDEDEKPGWPRRRWLALTNRLDESAIFEEQQGRFHEAKDVFKTLKGYFEDAGDYEGANWAYVREQVMEKLMRVPRPLRLLYPHWRGRWDDEYCDPGLFEWLRLEFSEKIANYGTSLTRPIVCLLVVILVFALLYLALGLVTNVYNCGYPERIFEPPPGTCHPTFNFANNLLFSLAAMTTADIAYLHPYRWWVGYLSTVETLVGIALTGLLGFVLGNKLRYS